jgi:hypothetical protein
LAVFHNARDDHEHKRDQQEDGRGNEHPNWLFLALVGRLEIQRNRDRRRGRDRLAVDLYWLPRVGGRRRCGSVKRARRLPVKAVLDRARCLNDHEHRVGRLRRRLGSRLKVGVLRKGREDKALVVGRTRLEWRGDHRLGHVVLEDERLRALGNGGRARRVGLSLWVKGGTRHGDDGRRGTRGSWCRHLCIFTGRVS